MINVNPMASQAYYLEYADQLGRHPDAAPKNEGFAYYANPNFSPDQHEAPGRWLGNLAADFGLTEGGGITAEAFASLYDGLHPLTGAGLVQNAKKPKAKEKEEEEEKDPKKRLAGIDLTLSQNHDVSLLYMFLPPEKQAALMQKHQEINDAIMKKMEAEVLARTRMSVDGIMQAVESEGVIIATFDHYETREVDLANNILVQKILQDLPPDDPRHQLAQQTKIAMPMLHSHNCMMNVTKGSDGVYRTTDLSGRLGKDVLLQYDYEAKARMADYLRAEGYTIVASPNNQEFRIAGISADLADFASQRRQEILEEVTQEGISDDLAAKKTRKGKTRLTLADWRTTWRTLTTNLGLAPDFANISAKHQIFNPATTALANVLTNNVYFSESELRLELLRLRQLQEFDVAAVQTEVMTDPGLIPITTDGKGTVYYATHTNYQKELQAEQQIQKLTQTGSHQLRNVAKIVNARAMRMNATLTAEQRLVVDSICADTGSVNLLQALAGCGKTFTNGFITEVFAQNGYQTYGLAPTNAARRQLAKDTGMAAFTLDRLQLVAEKIRELANNPSPRDAQGIRKFLDNPKNADVAKLVQTIQAGQKVLISLDEAGMLNQKQYENLLNLIEPFKDTVKLILTGDSNQLPSVAAGIPFKRLIERQMAPLTEMVNVFRQKDAADRNASELLGTAYAVQKQIDAQNDMFRVELKGYATVDGQLARTADLATQTNLISAQSHATQADAYAWVNTLLGLAPDAPAKYTLQFTETAQGWQIQDLAFPVKHEAENFLANYARQVAQERYDLALQHYADQGQIVHHAKPGDLFAQLVADYLADETPSMQKLILATRNADVNAINDLVRAHLVATGQVLAGHLFRTAGGVERLGVGDRVVFTAEKGDINKAEFGTIMELTYTNKNDYRLEVHTDDGVVKVLTPKDFGDELPIRRGYACTVHVAQGASKSSVRFYDSDFRSAELGYVALTRHKEDFQLYTTTDNLNTLAERMTKKIDKAALLDYQLPTVDPEKLTLAPELRAQLADAKAEAQMTSTATLAPTPSPTPAPPTPKAPARAPIRLQTLPPRPEFAPLVFTEEMKQAIAGKQVGGDGGKGTTLTPTAIPHRKLTPEWEHTR
jgi:ATP-dependent exoDNAse (exonuclease V) alpha subunit